MNLSRRKLEPQSTRLEYDMGLEDVRRRGFWDWGSPTAHASNDHAVSRSRTRRGQQFLRHCDLHDDSSWQTMLRRVLSHLTSFAECLRKFPI